MRPSLRSRASASTARRWSGSGRRRLLAIGTTARAGAGARYVVREVIPADHAPLRHVDPRRVAIGGISMGGFGALDLARLHRGRFCAVGGSLARHLDRRRRDGGGSLRRRGGLRPPRRRRPRPRRGASWARRPPVDRRRRGEPLPARGTARFVATLREAGARVTARPWPGRARGRLRGTSTGATTRAVYARAARALSLGKPRAVPAAQRRT